ncbi:NADPH:quinone reductase [Tilletia horrida]|nr:NADPH:quinone reductase [Tilletia horrida]
MSAALPDKMRAVHITKTGDIDVIEVSEVPVPKPGPTQVLIKAEWAGVNYIDTYFRGGLYKVPLPFVLGTEAAGIVVELGSDLKSSSTESLKVGDHATSFGRGAFAEYVAVDRASVAKVPSHLDLRTAAASTLQGLTALTLVREAYYVNKGDTVLVHAAAGGVGLLLCQLASHFGATVIGTVSTAAKAELAKAHGAHHVIIYGHDDYGVVPGEVLKLTDGKGVQAIFDGVGKASWEGDFEAIARKGTIVSFGNASGAVEPFAPLKLSAKNVKLVRPTLYGYVATQEETEKWSAELFELIEQGHLKINVHKEYPFTTEGVRQTQIDLTSRGTTGKLVIKL